MKDFLEYKGQSDIYGSRDAVRKSFELGLIENGEEWMDMMVSRNKTSHTYNEETAQEICKAVTGVYFSLLRRLEIKLGGLRSE